MGDEKIIVSYGGDRDGEFRNERPFSYILDVKGIEHGLFQPDTKAEVWNGAYRYVRLENFENIPGDYPNQPPLDIRMSDTILYKLYRGMGIRNIVDPRPGFVFCLGFLDSRAEKRQLFLDHDFIGKYRVEITGVNAFDIKGDFAPQKYHDPIIFNGIETTKWKVLWCMTIVTEIIIPLVGLTDISMTHWRTSGGWTGGFSDYVGLFTTLVSLAVVIAHTSSASSLEQGMAIFVSDLLNAIAGAVKNPASMPQGIARTLAQKAQTLILRFMPMKRFTRIFLWANFIEVSAMLATLFEAHTTDNYFVDIPSRYKTSVIPDPWDLYVGVTQKAGINLLLEWREVLLRIPGPRGERIGIKRQFDTEHSRFTAVGTIVYEQGQFDQAGPTIVLSDIVEIMEGDIMVPLSLTIKIRCDDDEFNPERALEPALWDRDTGDGPVALEFTEGIGELFRARRLGSGEITIGVINHSDFLLYSPYHSTAVETVPFQVAESYIHTQMEPELELTAGDRSRISYIVEMPDGTMFDSNEPFWADIELSDDGRYLIISEIWVASGGDSGDERRFDRVPINIVLFESSADSSKFINFVPPQPVDLEYGAHYSGLGDFIQARKGGSTKLKAMIQRTGDTTIGVLEPAETDECLIEIEDAVLSLALEALSGPESIRDTTLTIENDLISGNQGDNILVGAFAIEVCREEDILFDSRCEVLCEGTCGQEQLHIESIYVRDGSGDLVHLPFELIFDLDDLDCDEVAAFTLEAVSQDSVSGSFTINGSLGSVIKTTCGGIGFLRGRIVVPTAADGLDIVYTTDSSSSAQLQIDVPPPITAHLDAWKDGVRDVALVEGGAPEIIFNNGLISGRVDEFRGSPSEKIWIISPSHRYAYHEGDFSIEDDGSFQLECSGLVAGTNDLTIKAWKPIHEVTGDIGDRNASLPGTICETRSLEGVSPRDVSIAWAPNGQELIRQTNEYIFISYARCNEVRVTYHNPYNLESEGHDYCEGNGAFEAVMLENVGILQLDRRFGEHQVRLVAKNGFGQASEAVSTIALRPIIVITSPVSVSAGSYGGEMEVSDSTETVDVEGCLTNALGYRICSGEINTGTILSESDSLDGAEFQMPSTPLELAGGNNLISVGAGNDFGGVVKQIIITRASRYEVVSSSLTVSCQQGVVCGDNIRFRLYLYKVGGGYDTYLCQDARTFEWPPSGHHNEDDMSAYLFTWEGEGRHFDSGTNQYYWRRDAMVNARFRIVSEVRTPSGTTSKFVMEVPRNAGIAENFGVENFDESGNNYLLKDVVIHSPNQTDPFKYIYLLVE